MESTAMKDELERDKSFSFTAATAFKDYSSIAFFSDDNNDDDNKNDTTSDTDDSSFIEISLDHPKFEKPSSIDSTSTCDQRKLDQDLDHLRISFSSSFPSNIPEIQPDVVADFIEPAVIQASASSSSSFSSVRLSAPTFRSTSTGTCRGPVLGSESFSLHESSRRQDHLPKFNPLVHTLLFSLEPPAMAAAETVDENGCNHDHNWEDNHIQLEVINADHKYRKAPNITTATTSGGNNHNNGIMKLLMIKFRATKVRKLFTSLFAKSRSTGQLKYFSSNKENDRKRPRQYYSKETLDYYDRYDHEGMYYFGNDNVSGMKDIKSSCDQDDFGRRVGYKSRALDINFGAVRGVLEAVNMTKSGRKNRKTSSCPSSIKSSPIHQGFAGDVGSICPGENSIQAAIAHCKSSLGQSSDFRF